MEGQPTPLPSCKGVFVDWKTLSGNSNKWEWKRPTVNLLSSRKLKESLKQLINQLREWNVTFLISVIREEAASTKVRVVYDASVRPIQMLYC